jgi:DNA-binding transcriptional ArsR family regulator
VSRVLIVYQMVKYHEQLNQTFQALADPTRRALLARLQEADGLSISDLAQPLPMTLPAVMKHLDVLSDAGLIKRAKAGRTVTCRLSPEPMREAMDWLARYERFWTDNLDRLAAFVEAEQSPEKKED